MTYSSKVSNVSNKEISNTIYNGVRKVVSRRQTPWVGTMTQLGQLIQNRVNVPASVLPGSPSALRVVLNRVVRRLQNNGIRVRFTRDTSHMRTRLVEISVR